MRIAIVVQRYGEKCVGGAESHARLLAHHLKVRGHEPKVYTTTAVDYTTWKNELKVGEDSLDGISIERFDVVFPRNPKIFNPFNRIIQGLWRRFHSSNAFRILFRPLEKMWFLMQGPYSPSLVARLHHVEREHDLFVFFTYLYYPTIRGLPKLSDKSILIPTAHDEIPFYFTSVKTVLQKAKRLVVNVEAEKKLIMRVHKIEPSAIEIGAMGLEPMGGQLATANEKYLIYLGRVGRAKSTDEIIRLMIQRWDEGKNNLKLYLAGGKEDGFEIPAHPAIKFLGFVSNQEKQTYLNNAVAVINPSRFESLSMIVLEGLLSLKQIIVHTHCEVLRDYVQALTTVYGYGTDDEFMDVLDRTLVLDPQTISDRLYASKKWAEEEFSWDLVIQNIETACAQSPEP